MDRKQELEKIIADAEIELAPLKRHETRLYWAELSIKEFKNDYELSEEEVSSLVDAIYHPNGDLTDEGNSNG